MASSVPSVEHVNEVQQRVTGDAFIRSHLRKLSPYQPILPFEVFYPPLLGLFLLIWLVLCDKD